MKLSEIIDGTSFQSGYTEELQRWLKKIEILNNKTPEGNDVSIDNIEKLLFKLSKKYNIKPQYTMFTILDDEKYHYSLSIIDGETHTLIKYVYGVTIYEVFAKCALFIYSQTRRR